MGSLEVISQVFALVHETQGLGLSSIGNSGILGLSFSSIASIPQSTGSTVLENILSPFDEQNRFFAFKLGRGAGVQDSSSSFTVGALDQDIVSDMSMFLITPVCKAGAESYNYWKLPLQSLAIDNTAFPLSPSLVPEARAQIAVLDTGTTLILGPTRDVDAFWRIVDNEGATRKNKITGLWELRCDRPISVSFILGNSGHERSFSVDPADINWKGGGESGDWCLGGVQANDGVNSGDWLLGDVFLRNVYVIHHLGNSTHEPFIGLLSMTNETDSLSNFRKLRGSEQPHGGSHWMRQDITLESRSTILVYTISSVCGFITGAVITISIRRRYNQCPLC
ncbi:hypothetical protein H0H87_012864 [Tephrocybe sp. NHM501043]|nr:hypothetical protein H0H87_012864 [Tephrocybe sp. NHM501043]